MASAHSVLVQCQTRAYIERLDDVVLFFSDQETTWSAVVYVYLLGTDHLISDVRLSTCHAQATVRVCSARRAVSTEARSRGPYTLSKPGRDEQASTGRILVRVVCRVGDCLGPARAAVRWADRPSGDVKLGKHPHVPTRLTTDRNGMTT